MQHAVVVGKLQRFADLRNEEQRLLGRDAGAHRLAEIHAIDELHEQVEEAAAFAEVVDADDVRVAELCEGAGFAGEALGKAGLRGERGREDFQSDEPVELWLPCFEDDAHAALPKELQHLQLGEGCGDFIEHRHAGSGDLRGARRQRDAKQRATRTDAAGRIRGDG